MQMKPINMQYCLQSLESNMQFLTLKTMPRPELLYSELQKTFYLKIDKNK